MPNDAYRRAVRSREFLRFVGLWVVLLTAQCAQAQDAGSISGKVTDSSGAPILGAVVRVEGADGISWTTVTDGEGAFRISPLKPGNYGVKISASGLADWRASNIPASVAPESKPLMAVMQVAPAVFSVTVAPSREEVAEEQLKQETKQRVLGVLPNYYVAYENATPLSPRQKSRLALKTLFDPATIAGVGITAGIQQSMNSYHQFGQGAEGYAKRFGAAYLYAANYLLITTAISNSILHQDPRYFYDGKGPVAQRVWYALKSSFRAKGDNGKWQPPYSGVIGSLAAAEISQTYYPGSRTQYTLLGRNLMFHFAGTVGLNLAQEFLLDKLTTNKPRLQTASRALVLREGAPVKLIAVEGLGAQPVTAGQTVTFVLAQDLTQSGQVLAKAGDVASGTVSQVSVGNGPTGPGSVALQNVTLRAGDVNIPLRSNQVRGAVTPLQRTELPGSGKVEVTLFVAQDVEFPASD